MTSDQLKRRLRGSLIPVIHPGRRTGIARARSAQRHTTLIVRAADAGDIREAVRYAHLNRASVALRQCRRPAAEAGPPPDVVIDICALNTLRIDAATLQARVEPCAPVDQLVAALDRRGLAFPFPRHRAGSLGGCLLDSATPQSPQQRAAAWRAVIAMDVVQSDGSLVTVIPPKGAAPDTWREAGGAAGGIVTAFRLRLHRKEQAADGRATNMAAAVPA